MPLAYSCGTQIEKLETISSIKGLYLDIQNNGCKIPISMVTNDATFGMLSALWLEECIHFMWWYGNGIPEGLTEDLKAPDEFLEREIGCFYEKAGEKERADFLCRYKEALTDQDFPDICNSKRADDIFQEIDRKIGEARSYLILRVKAVCLLTNCRPEELFEEGQGWTDSIPIKSDDYFELSNNMVFALDPMGEKEIDLVPKTLRNDSGSSCTIYVSYFDKDHTENNRQYSITLPPYGILRVVFTNRDLRKLRLSRAIYPVPTPSARSSKAERKTAYSYIMSESLKNPWRSRISSFIGTPRRMLWAERSSWDPASFTPPSPAKRIWKKERTTSRSDASAPADSGQGFIPTGGWSPNSLTTGNSTA